MILTSEKDFEAARESGKRLAYIRDLLAEKTVAGITTAELDALAHELCTRDGDKPAFLDYQPFGAPRAFPASICISINDVVVHGIPTENPQTIKDGDLVTLDVGLIHNGIVTDTAITVGVGTITDREKELIKTAEIALSKAIETVHNGARIEDISKAIEKVVHAKGFGIPVELGGHGVGRKVHEEPSISNVSMGGRGPKLSSGELIAIEPIITMGSPDILFDENDGYTIRTKDGSKSAHSEHTILVTERGAEILT